MVIASPGTTVRIDSNRLNEVTDGRGRVLKFEEDKDGIEKAKHKDGSESVINPSSTLVEIITIGPVDEKALRKAMPGYPLSKDKAKKFDEENRKEQEEAEKQAEEQGTESPEAESFKKRSAAPDEGPPGRKAR